MYKYIYSIYIYMCVCVWKYIFHAAKDTGETTAQLREHPNKLQMNLIAQARAIKMTRNSAQRAFRQR